jgi:hypothetical protein
MKEISMRPRTRALIACCALLPLASACATVAEQRVEAGLAEAGVPLGIATCMADIWAEELSISQIRRISRFADAVRDRDSRLTVGRLVTHVREWNDPEAMAVVTGSAARCAFE